MPLQAINYASLPVQGDPMSAGMMDAILKGMQMKYAKPNMQADLQKKQLANALSQVNLDYADPMAQATLDYAQAQTPYLKSQTSGQDLQNALANVQLQYAPEMSQADLDLKKLEIPYKKTQTDLMPADTLAKLLGGAGRYNQSSWQSSPNSQLIRTLNNPQMQSLISNNPEVGASVAKTLGNIGLGNSTGDTSGSSFQLSNDMINAIMGAGQSGGMQSGGMGDTGQQSLSPWAQQQMGAMQQRSPQMMQGQQQQPQFTPSQQDIDAVMNNAGDAALKKTTTAQQLNQRIYAKELDGLFEEGTNLMPSVIKYAGLLGKSKEGKDKVLSQFQKNDPDYQNYWNFTHNVAPNVANEMRRTLGGQATDYEGKLMADLSSPVYWDSNPELAMGQWNHLTNLYKTKINPVVYGNPSKLTSNMKDQMNNLTISPEEAQQLAQAGIAKPGRAQGMGSNIGMPSQEDLEHTAKQYGMTVDQVRQKLGLS